MQEKTPDFTKVSKSYLESWSSGKLQLLLFLILEDSFLCATPYVLPSKTITIEEVTCQKY